MSKVTFKEVTKASLPNGGVAVMAKDGTMLFYAKREVANGQKQRWDFTHKSMVK